MSKIWKKKKHLQVFHHMKKVTSSYFVVKYFDGEHKMLKKKCLPVQHTSSLTYFR